MSGQSTSAPTAPSVTRRLADRLARPVFARDRARAAACVLDWTGCALAGAASEVGAIFARQAGAGLSMGPCTLVGGGRAAPGVAAFANGALGNVLEMDDVDKRAILHPGPTVIPAALSAAQALDADAGAFLDAVVRGYEAVIRLGRAVGPAHYAHWHNTGTCGPFGAAAAAASLYQLGPEAVTDALGLAGTQAGGLWQTRHEPASNAKQLHTARAAQAGLIAAELAAAGAHGPHFILEGPQGFFAATCGPADPQGVLAFAPDAAWAIHEVSIKPWPACRHAHAAIDAALVLRDQGVTGDAVEHGRIRVYADAALFCDTPDPQTVLQAKFSLQHAVAVTLMDGPPALAAFDVARIHDAPTAALRARLSVKVGPPYDAAYPERYGAGLEVTLRNGQEAHASAPDALGDPENPLSPEALDDKALTLLQHAGLTRPDSARLIAAARGLEAGDRAALAEYGEALNQARVTHRKWEPAS